MTRDEAIRYIETGRAEGIPDEELVAEIKKRHSLRASDVPLAEYGPGGTPYPAGTGQTVGRSQMDAVRQIMQGPTDYLKKNALPIAGAVAGGLVGGRAAQAIPYLQSSGVGPAIGRAVAYTAGEAAGMFGGTVAAQSEGQKDYGQAAKAAGIQAILSGTNQAMVPLMGKAGGIEAKKGIEAIGRPDFVRRVKSEAEHLQGVRTIDTAANIPTTPGRLEIERLIGKHDAGKKTIDVMDAMQKLEPYLEQGVTPASHAAGAEMKNVGERLFNKFVEAAPDGKISAAKFDEILRKELTNPYGPELNNIVGASEVDSRIMRFRNDLAGHLYDSLGSGAKEAGAQASKALIAKEKVEHYFPTDKFGDPQLNVAGRIAAVGSDMNPSAATLRAKLVEFDQIHNTNLTQEAVSLGYRREWGKRGAKRAAYISSLLNVPAALRSESMLRDMFRAWGRTSVRGQGMVGAVARGATTAYLTPERREKQRKAFELAMGPTP